MAVIFPDDERGADDVRQAAESDAVRAAMYATAKEQLAELRAAFVRDAFKALRTIVQAGGAELINHWGWCWGEPGKRVRVNTPAALAIAMEMLEERFDDVIADAWWSVMDEAELRRCKEAAHG